MRILVVEDEEELASALVEALVDKRYVVDLAMKGETARELALANDYDLVVLDWTIPPPNGVELLREWRAEGVTFPVLMLTGRRLVRDRVNGLDVGADDYLTKPFAFAELLARVRSLLRRRERVLHSELGAGDLVMDRAGHAVMVGGSSVQLSPKEFALLEYLLVRKGQVVPRQELAEHVWDEAPDSASNVIDVIVHRLRRKIDGDRKRKLLHTVIGVGYIVKQERC